MFPTEFATALIFLLTYGGIALGRIPGFRLDRAGITLTGAALMMAIGAITPDEAYRALNLDTLALLLGMMIIVAHLRLSGFFRLVTRWAVAHAHSPLILLATVAATAGAFSAFLVNDAVCLVMAPLVIEVTRSLRRDPIPYLLGVAMASQNMIAGAVSRIPYTDVCRGPGAGGAGRIAHRHRGADRTLVARVSASGTFRRQGGCRTTFTSRS
jgi:Na+/H+ antiporter NhaD/arsenite permease-like protein